MSRINEYFSKSFQGALSLDKSVTCQSADSSCSRDVLVRIHLDFISNARYLSVLISDAKDAGALVTALLDNLAYVLQLNGVSTIQMPRNLELTAEGLAIRVERRPDTSIIHAAHIDGLDSTSQAVPFTGRVFIYSEFEIDASVKTRLLELTKASEISLIFRGPSFAVEIDRRAKPRAFISHDSRDKADIALPIAIGMERLLCHVWYDEFSVMVGENLRESVERGIQQCGFCVLVLTPNFLANGGWTKREYDMAFTKELVDERDVILPVWAGVSRQEVYDYSPALAGKLGVSWDLGVDEVCRRLSRRIDHAPDPLEGSLLST